MHMHETNIIVYVLIYLFFFHASPLSSVLQTIKCIAHIIYANFYLVFKFWPKGCINYFLWSLHKSFTLLVGLCISLVRISDLRFSHLFILHLLSIVNRSSNFASLLFSPSLTHTETLAHQHSTAHGTYFRWCLSFSPHVYPRNHLSCSKLFFIILTEVIVFIPHFLAIKTHMGDGDGCSLVVRSEFVLYQFNSIHCYCCLLVPSCT